MKNLIIASILILLTSNITYSQNVDSLIDEITLNEISSNSGIYLKHKSGDNDLSTIGLLELIFSDNTSKYKYGKINPRIELLIVHNIQNNLELPFWKWIEDNVNSEIYSDSTKYRIVYEGFGYGSEDLRIYDINTGECIRWICIWYDNFNDSNEFQNIGSISDNIIYE